MYEELQVVKATKNLSDKVKMGCIGTILYVYFEAAFADFFCKQTGTATTVSAVNAIKVFNFHFELFISILPFQILISL